jgi:hypothetical protein
MQERLVNKSIVNSAPMWLRVTTLTIFAASVVINAYFGVWGPHSTAEVSDRYSLFVTPPKWTFGGIWSTIYLLFAVSLIYVAVTDQWPSKAYWSAIAASIFNAIWLGVFSIGTNTSIVACLFIILALFTSLYILWTTIANILETDWKYFAVRNVISFYMGWILIASMLGFGMVLVYTLGVSQRAFTIVFWVLTPLLFIGITVVAYGR